jgi:hypothetical protein
MIVMHVFFAIDYINFLPSREALKDATSREVNWQSKPWPFGDRDAILELVREIAALDLAILTHALGQDDGWLYMCVCASIYSCLWW